MQYRVQSFRDSRQETMFNQVLEKLLIYAAGSGVSSGQRLETALGRFDSACRYPQKESRNVVSGLRCWNTLLLQPRRNRFIKCEIGRNCRCRRADGIELVFRSNWKDSSNGSEEFKCRRIGGIDCRGAQSFCR